jgi:hypothetical protein
MRALCIALLFAAISHAQYFPPGGGAGSVTVVSAGNLTNTALVTGGGLQKIQTPAPTATMDGSGNISTPGSISSGVGGSVAGGFQMSQGTANTPAANSIVLQAPTSVTAYSIAFPTIAGTGFLLNTDTANVDALTFVGFSGTGNVVRTNSPALVTPDLGTPSAINLTNATGFPATIPTIAGVQANYAHCFDSNGTHDGSVANPIACNTTPAFTVGASGTLPNNGAGAVIWVGFNGNGNADGFRINLNGAGAIQTFDACGNSVSAGQYVGANINGAIYYPFTWDDVNSAWASFGPCSGAVGGVRNLNVTNTIPRTSSNGVGGFQLVLSAIKDDGTTTTIAEPVNATRYQTAINCSSAASPAVCTSAAAGSVVVAAAATSVVVNTSAVTANSQIFVFYSSALGTKLGVTCNTTIPALYGETARTPGTSFTLGATASITNPACFSFFIVN